MSGPQDEGLRAPAPGATDRRSLLVGGALLGAAALTLAFTPRNYRPALGAAKLEDLVPNRIGPWAFESRSGLILPPPDQLRDAIYNQLATRVYQRGDGAVIMLLIAYSERQQGNIQVHRPEVCYPASGLRILSIEPGAVRLAGGREVPVRRMTAEGAMRTEKLIYWTRIGSRFPGTWADQHLAVMGENLEGYIPDGVLVRVSAFGGDDADAMLDSFTAALVATSGDRLRRVMLGSA